MVILFYYNNLKVINKSLNKLMSIYKFLAYFRKILQIIINNLIIKINNYIKQIILKIQYIQSLKRKDHTPLKTSYNKS